MSLTITRVPDGEDLWGRRRVTMYDLTLDDDYVAATGYPIAAQDVGFKSLYGALVIAANQAAGKLLFVFDKNNDAGEVSSTLRLRAFFPTGGAATAPTALNAPVGITAAGAVAVTGDADDAAVVVTPGVAKEVAESANLATIKLRVVFFGL